MPVDLNKVWKQTLAIMSREMLKPSFETWIKNMRPIAFYDNTMIIAVPNPFARDWIQSRYAEKIAGILSSILGHSVQLKFIIPPGDEHGDLADLNPEIAVTLPKPRPTNGDSLYQPLNPNYTFDTFVVGNSNRLAHAASLAVAEAPAKAYNPLFIYGGVGLGKTHLMHAIGHFVLRHNPGLKVAYVTSEMFTNELITSIREDKTVEFRERYRSVDVLLVDDIQFLAGKERTQEEFFHTFNTLHEANRQLVISSDRPPKEIPTLEERLRSRFEWGLLSDIQPPDLETRVAILQKKAKMSNLRISDEVIQYVASKIKTNIRELEGALIRIVAYSSLTKQDITLEMATVVLKDILPKENARPISIPLIQQVVANHYNLKVSDLKGKKRTKAIAFPRHIAMYLCRELTDQSLPKIGEEFGGRDHTTVLHACEKISKDITADPSLEAAISKLINTIRSS